TCSTCGRTSERLCVVAPAFLEDFSDNRVVQASVTGVGSLGAHTADGVCISAVVVGFRSVVLQQTVRENVARLLVRVGRVVSPVLALPVVKWSCHVVLVGGCFGGGLLGVCVVVSVRLGVR